MTNEQNAPAVLGPVERRLGVTAPKTDVRRFIALASKPHAHIAGALADEIKATIYRHAGKVPLALVIGVLRIVEKELLDDA